MFRFEMPNCRYVTLVLLALVVVLLLVVYWQQSTTDTADTIDTFECDNNFVDGKFVPCSTTGATTTAHTIAPPVPNGAFSPTEVINDMTMFSDVNTSSVSAHVFQPAMQHMNQNVYHPATQNAQLSYQQTTEEMQATYKYSLQGNPTTNILNSPVPAKTHLSNLNKMIQEASKTTGKLAGQTHLISHMFMPIMDKAYQESRPAITQKHAEMVQECLRVLGCTGQYEPNRIKLERVMSKKLDEMMNEVVLPMFSVG